MGRDRVGDGQEVGTGSGMTQAPPSVVGETDIMCLREEAASTPPGCFVEIGVFKISKTTNGKAIVRF
jgi:hypothetical protein